MVAEAAGHGSVSIGAGRSGPPAPDDAERREGSTLPEGAKGLAERNDLVTEHLPLARAVARRFARRGEPVDDLEQVASVALVAAADRFDPGQGSFPAYAVPCMVGELKRHFRDRGWSVRAPRRIQELHLELGAAVERLWQSLGRSPTPAELAAEVGAPEADVLEAMEAGRGYRSASLDAPTAEGATMSDMVGTEEPGFGGVENHSVLMEAIEQLPERERTILQLRFVEGLSQSAIATRLGYSQMHISRLLAASLDRLRDNFGLPDTARSARARRTASS